MQTQDFENGSTKNQLVEVPVGIGITPKVNVLASAEMPRKVRHMQPASASKRQRS